jgi:hypothetical protein
MGDLESNLVCQKLKLLASTPPWTLSQERVVHLRLVPRLGWKPVSLGLMLNIDEGLRADVR